MSKRANLVALLVVLALVPSALAAQDALPAAPSGAAPPTAVAGGADSLGAVLGPIATPASWSSTRPGEGASFAPARLPESASSLASMFPPRHRAPGVALMIVGGAGIVVGALIGADLITVAGAGVGLYGLYLYLR